MANNISTDDLMAKIAQYNFNPSEIMRLFLKATEEVTNGAVTFFDASNPTILAIEAGVITPAACLQEIGSITRRLYAPAVDDWGSLFLHMNDIDINEMADQPGSAEVMFLLSVDEIKRRALPLNGNEDIRIIEFPAHTQVIVNDYSLMFKYPFTIRINKYGNISIKYNLNHDNILGSISNAVINYEYTRLEDMDVIRIPIECVQVALNSQVISVSPSSGFLQRVKLHDKFFKLKAYTQFGQNNTWVELDVTRRMRVLNKNKATIQITVDNTKKELTVKVPTFYFNNSMIGTSIRLDVYTTKGNVTHSLANYNDGAYQIKYFDHNNRNNPYAGLLGSLSVLKAYSVDSISGGRDALTFNEVKDRVINRSTISEGLPITELEINNRLGDLGFSTVKVKDNVTERIFAASRLIPAPNNTGLTVTGIGCNVQSYQTTINELAKLKTVKNNGNRLTVLPNTLYNVVNGVLTVIDQDIVDTYTDPRKTAPENLSAWANANSLVFSPYYYVHDVSNNEYTVRTYRLDNPQVESKITINENPTLQLDAGVFNYQLLSRPSGDGYTLLVGLAVGVSFKELPIQNVSVQIAYTDETGENRYFLEGSLATPLDQTTGRPIDDNYIYRFDLNTNWDIDANHNLILNSGSLPFPLHANLDIFIIVKDFEPYGFAKTEMDNIVNVNSLNNFDGRGTQHALIQERLSVRLGKYMENLWHRSRTTIGEADYKRYEENVPATYKEVVYKRDRNNVIETGYNQDTNRVEPVILHHVGDPVYDPETNLPIYTHKIGDIVMENGQPVYKEGLRGLKRQYDLIVMDGLYYLTTHENTISYVREILNVIDTWVFDILGDRIKPELLERTEIFYHPKSTVGMIEVYVENGVKVLVQSDQSLYVKFFVNKAVHSNLDLRNTIEITSKQVIQSVLESKSTISATDITSALKEALGDNVMGIELKGFMDDMYNTISIVNELTTPSIGKRLSVNSKLELVVEDDVEFDFVWHNQKST